MAWLTHLIFLTVLLLFHCECTLNHQTLDELWEKKLHKDLMVGYKWYENPNSCNATEVKLKIIMKSFNLDSDLEIFSMYAIMLVTWSDERLKWNASDYGGLTDSYFYRLEHWAPYIELNNQQEDDYGFFYDECKVDHTGEVTCSPRVYVMVPCTTHASDWPHDTQYCTLEYKIHDEQKNIHILPRGSRAVSSFGAAYGAEFTITDYHEVSNTSDKIQLKVTFTLVRNSDRLAVMIIFPAILLSILTVSSLILDVKDKNRWYMVLFSTLCHCFYMSGLGWVIPLHSDEPPTILLFYRSSLMITLFLLSATVFLAKLRNRETVPPSWISSVYSFIFNSKGKYIIWPRWKTNVSLLSSDDVDVKCVEVWNGFANIMNSVCFSVSVFVYSIMIPVLVPQPETF